MLVAVVSAEEDARAQDLIWVIYESPGLGYRIEYPAALFGQPFPLQGSDGFNVSSPDGRARLVVFGAPNTTADATETLANQLAAAADVDRVTYRRVTEQWLVLSGYLTSGDIFYGAQRGPERDFGVPPGFPGRPARSL